VILHNIQPFHISSLITHKPPGPGDTFTSSNPVQLFDNFGQPSSYQLLSGTFVPDCIPPKLSATTTANGKLTLCWPALCGTAFRVQCASNLAPPINWQAITNAATTTNGQYCVTVDISPASRFYRVVR
jgi:hypothetical protein